MLVPSAVCESRRRGGSLAAPGAAPHQTRLLAEGSIALRHEVGVVTQTGSALAPIGAIGVVAEPLTFTPWRSGFIFGATGGLVSAIGAAIGGRADLYLVTATPGIAMAAVAETIPAAEGESFLGTA